MTCIEKKSDTNPLFQFDIESARKRMERHLEKVLKILGVDFYKEDLQVPYRGRMKYQFSEEDVQFLRELASKDVDDKNQDDLYWMAVGIYNCFCHVKDIDESLLEDIGNIIQQKIGFSELKYAVALKNRLENINSFADELTKSKKYSMEEKGRIYEKMLKDLDDLIQQWYKIK